MFWTVSQPLISIVFAGVASLAAGSAAACPDWSLTGRQLSYSSDQLWAQQTVPVIAGGANPLANCPQPGVGYVATQPDFDLNFTGNAQARDLEFRVSASCDTVLLVNDARGQWHFDDDGGGGTNSRLRLPGAADGAYDIWVGTYGPATCQATLSMVTLTGGTGAPQPPVPPQRPPVACPDPQANGQMLTHGGAALSSAQRYGVVAGGNIDLASCRPLPGHGWVIQNPDFTVNFTDNPQGFDLEFRTEASCDPVLLVSAPDGQWHFNDDDNGLNSRLRLPGAQPGQYDVWVGTYGAQTCQASLIIQSFGGRVTTPPAPPSGSMLFPEAVWNNERADWCLTWGADCGQGGADRFCALQGYTGAAAGGWGQVLVGRTLVLGDGQICTGSCGALINVTCVGAGYVPPGPLTRDPSQGQGGARLLAVYPDGGRDVVGRGESLAPNGEADGLYRFGITAPGQTIGAISVQSTSGAFSVWDTTPNGYWLGAAFIGEQMFSRGDSALSIPLGAGETVIDFFVQQLEGRVGQDSMRITVTFVSGATTEILVPPNFTGTVVGGGAPILPPGGGRPPGDNK